MKKSAVMWVLAMAVTVLGMGNAMAADKAPPKTTSAPKPAPNVPK